MLSMAAGSAVVRSLMERELLALQCFLHLVDVLEKGLGIKIHEVETGWVRVNDVIRVTVSLADAIGEDIGGVDERGQACVRPECLERVMVAVDGRNNFIGERPAPE